MMTVDRILWVFTYMNKKLKQIAVSRDSRIKQMEAEIILHTTERDRALKGSAKLEEFLS